MNEEQVIYKILKNKIDPEYCKDFFIRLRIQGVYKIHSYDKINILNDCRTILLNLDKCKLYRNYLNNKCFIRLVYEYSYINIYFSFDFFTRYFNMNDVRMLSEDKNKFKRLIKFNKLK